MKKHTRFLLILALGLIAGLAVVKLKHITRPASLAQVAPTKVTPALTRALEVTPITPAADLAQETHSAVRPLSVSLREALPKLAEPVKDWREYKPERIVIAPYPDTPMEFERTSIRMENGRTVWNGRNALTGAFLVLVATEKDWHAVLEIPASDNFELQLSDGKMTVVQTSGAGGCGVDQLKLRQKAALSPDLSTEPTPSDSGVVAKTAIDGFTHVDVIFFYDAATLSTAGSFSAIETAAIARIASANDVLINSAITNLRWRYVAAYQIPSYAASTDIEDDLDRISDIQQSRDAIPDNTQRDFVTNKMAAHGADQALLYITGTRSASGNTVGLAWSPQSVSGNLSRGAARSVVMWRRTSDGFSSGYGTMSHELAHNFSCQHDRETEKQTTDNPDGAYDGDGKYWYGHSFGGNGTIMSYLGTRIPYFSNPNVSYAGAPTGVAVDQPKAAYNAKVLADKALGMTSAGIGNSGRDLLPPVITTQPQSAIVNLGASFSFNVVSQGAITGYQWQKSGTAISGATGKTYSVSSATAADADYYNVIIMNPVAASISSSVTATVTGSSSSSSSSGGAVVAPAITTQPVSFSGSTPGVSVTLSVVATGTDLRYQWYFASQALLGANSASYTIPSLSGSNSGTYLVVVSNLAGSVPSAYADVMLTGTSSSSSSSSSSGSPAPAPAPAPSGGGGGGGAMPIWMLAALGFLAFARLLIAAPRLQPVRVRTGTR
ncbi:MAG: M12 family metallo-peptidase [Nibricoccus sp.]